MSTEIDGRLREGEPVSEPPEIELIALGLATEAAEAAACQVDRQAASITFTQRIVNEAWSAKLSTVPMGRLVLEEFQHLGHRDGGTQRRIVDSRHVLRESVQLTSVPKVWLCR